MSVTAFDWLYTGCLHNLIVFVQRLEFFSQMISQEQLFSSSENAYQLVRVKSNELSQSIPAVAYLDC